MKRRFGRTTFAAVLLLGGMPACGEWPTTPQAVPVVLMSDFDKKLSSYVVDGTFHMYMDVGLVKLDMRNSVLEFPNGRKITQLPTSVVEHWATAFQTLIDDPASQAKAMLESDEPPADTAIYDCKNGFCETLRAPQFDSRHRVNGRPQGRVGRTRIRPFTRRAPASSSTVIPFSATASLTEEPANCYDASLYLYNMVQEHRSAESQANYWLSQIDDMIKKALEPPMDPIDIFLSEWVCKTQLMENSNGDLVPVETCEYMFAA